MPTYEIKCEMCDTAFDVISSYKNRLKTPCPKCGSSTVHSLVSSPSIITTGDSRIPEFSVALGKPVKNKQDYVDGLKKIGANVDAIMEHPY